MDIKTKRAIKTIMLENIKSGVNGKLKGFTKAVNKIEKYFNEQKSKKE